MGTKYGFPPQEMTLVSKIMYLALGEQIDDGIRISYNDGTYIFSVYYHNEEFMSADLESAIDLAVDFANEIVDSVVEDVLSEKAEGE